MRDYRAARAKRETAAARKDAVCAARGCSRSLGKGSGRGLCHAHIQKSYLEERRLGPVEKSRTEAIKEFWAIVEQYDVPLEAAAAVAELRLTDSLVAELLVEAKRRRISFENLRYWYDKNVREVMCDVMPEEPWERARYVPPKQTGPEPKGYEVPA